MLDRPYIIYLRLKNQPTPEILHATRLPSTNETLEDWMNSEIIKVDEEVEPSSGLLYVDSNEVVAISFRLKQSEEERRPGVHRMPR